MLIVLPSMAPITFYMPMCFVHGDHFPTTPHPQHMLGAISSSDPPRRPQSGRHPPEMDFQERNPGGGYIMLGLLVRFLLFLVKK